MQKFQKIFKDTLHQHKRDILNATTFSTSRAFSVVTLPKNSNQARGLAEYAIDFMKLENKKIGDEVYDRVRLFHTDSVICGVSAIALKTNAPNILRDEAINRFSVNPDKRYLSLPILIWIIITI